MNKVKQFSGFKKYFWPISKQEQPKILPMLGIFFLITFIYNLLRPLKLALIVSAEGSGAEIIPYLKFWAVLPAAFVSTYVFTIIANKFSRQNIFYFTLLVFGLYFVIFTLLLFPNRQKLELNTAADVLLKILPLGCRGFISLVRHWNLALFYVMAELWASVVLSMVFWGFANESTSVDDAKRFYGIFVLASNVSSIFCGLIGQGLNLETAYESLPYSAWEQSVYLMMGLTIILCIAIVYLFYYLTKNLSSATEFTQNELPAKVKLSLLSSFKHLIKSAYLRNITIIVMAFNLVYNLSEVMWIDLVQQNLPLAKDFNNYMHQMTTWTGVFSTLMALGLCGNIIRRFGWLRAALISPVIWGILSFALFMVLILNDTHYLSPLLLALDLPVKSLVFILCSGQISLGRSSKYTVFDETKEMAFVPLSAENQRKSKAIVDGLAGWVGRSGGSLLYQALLIYFINISSTVPIVALFILIAIFIWINCVRRLDLMMKQQQY